MEKFVRVVLRFPPAYGGKMVHTDVMVAGFKYRVFREVRGKGGTFRKYDVYRVEEGGVLGRGWEHMKTVEKVRAVIAEDLKSRGGGSDGRDGQGAS